MSKIHIMPDVLASQVAAGEVVERPASVIKELVENSLDANAKTIAVEIMRGGISQMKITDDGSGMNEQDALIAFERHATSKLLSVEDLFEISQMGFRGEALPSIASIAKVKLKTREHQAIEGCELAVQGGVMSPVKACGIPPGTCIEVSDLFFNTPARKKFLKSEETEASHIEHQIRLHAMAFPAVRFIFKKNGQTCFDLPATNDLRHRIAGLTDSIIAESLTPIIPYYGPGVTINGYLLPLSESRKSRKNQYIFLNNRPVEDKLVARAIRDGYGGLPAGTHPALFLYIDIEPVLVDINVHPAKREVRFRRPADVVSSIIEAISQTLSAQTQQSEYTAPSIGNEQHVPSLPDLLPAPLSPKPQKGNPTPESKTPVSVHPSTAIPIQQPVAIKPLQPSQMDLEATLAPQKSKPFPFRFIGTLKGKFGLFENEDGLAILYPKAARERILFEQINAGKTKNLVSQYLLEPILLELDPRDFVIVTELSGHFEKAGIILSPFGQRTIRIEAVPGILKLSDTKSFILDLIDKISHSEFAQKASRIAYEMFAEELSKQTVKYEQIDLTHSVELLKMLLACEVPYCTPSGKPTLVMFSMQDINRKFNIS